MALNLKAALTKSPEGGLGAGAAGLKGITKKLMKPTTVVSSLPFDHIIGKLQKG